jgi:hypothetical protein
MDLRDIGVIVALVTGTYGAILSTINTWLNAREKQRRLHVDVEPAIYTGRDLIFWKGEFPDTYQSSPIALVWTATNPGHKPVTINYPGLILPDKSLKVFQWRPERSPYPKEVTPGTVHQDYAWAYQVAQDFKQRGYQGAVELVGFFYAATGKMYKSRPFRFDIERWLSSTPVVPPESLSLPSNSSNPP